jgi:topoisomerase-4 subunit A
MVYLEGKSGVSYIKRFQITAVTRDREYDLTQGTPRSKVTYFTANDNGEAEIITINLMAQCKAKVKQFDFNFADLLIKNRNANGNILTKYPIRKITLKQAGVSTLGGVDIWYNTTIGRLNRDERGIYLGNFDAKDSILVIYREGSYELTNFDLTNHFEPAEILLLTKFDAARIITAVYFDNGQKIHYIKRFQIETTTADKKFLFISEAKGSKLLLSTLEKHPRLQLSVQKSAKSAFEVEDILAEEAVDVRGWRAMGNKLAADRVKEMRWLEPLPDEELNGPPNFQSDFGYHRGG